MTQPSADVEAREPVRIVRGSATPEELAAVVVVLTAAASGTPEESRPGNRWGHRSRLLTPSPGRFGVRTPYRS